MLIFHQKGTQIVKKIFTIALTTVLIIGMHASESNNKELMEKRIKLIDTYYSKLIKDSKDEDITIPEDLTIAYDEFTKEKSIHNTTLSSDNWETLLSKYNTLIEESKTRYIKIIEGMEKSLEKLTFTNYNNIHKKIQSTNECNFFSQFKKKNYTLLKTIERIIKDKEKNLEISHRKVFELECVKKDFKKFYDLMEYVSIFFIDLSSEPETKTDLNWYVCVENDLRKKYLNSESRLNKYFFTRKNILFATVALVLWWYQSYHNSLI